MISSRFAGNFLVDLIGVWQHGTYRAMPVGGLCYYMTAPESIAKAFLEPLHSVLYILFMLGSCAFLSVKWIDVSKYRIYSNNRPHKVVNNFLPSPPGITVFIVIVHNINY